jgi:hypothetical protein
MSERKSLQKIAILLNCVPILMLASIRHSSHSGRKKIIIIAEFAFNMNQLQQQQLKVGASRKKTTDKNVDIEKSLTEKSSNWHQSA